MNNIVKLPSRKDLVTKYTKMGVGSIVCAVPFAIVTYLFPLPMCKGGECLTTVIIHSLVANTILHAISWNLILTDSYWYYRLPILPFEKAYQLFHNALLKQAEKQLLLLKTRQKNIYQKYKNRLSHFFVSSADRIANDSIKKSDGGRRSLQIHESNSSLLTFINRADSTQAIHPQTEPRSCIGAACHALHRFLKNGGIGFLGGSFIVVGCMGLIANPIYVGFIENLTILESVAAGILPSYSTAVLCAFYGTVIFNMIYQYLTTWDEGLSGKFSFEAKLYPKTFALFLLFNLYVSAFAYGTALQLISTVFGAEMWDAYRPYLEGISMPGFQILSFVPLLTLFNSFVRKSIAKFGAQNDETLTARLLVKTNIMSQRIQQLKGKVLLDSIQKFSAIQQKIMGIVPEEFQNDFKTIQSISQEKKEISTIIKQESGQRNSCCWNFLYSFWQRHKENEVKEPLLANDIGSTEPSHEFVIQTS